MKTNERGLNIITSFEGWSSTPYLCPAGVPTIGYGSIWRRDGACVTMEHPEISNDEGEFLLRRELRHVEAAIGKLVKTELTENMFSALASFTYNLGSGNLQASTLRMKLKRGDYEGAADEFPKWRRAGGKILPGLVRRRAAERALFLR